MHSIAPGKIILCGEHAVVFKCPALVIAVNRHAHTRIRSNNNAINLDLKDLDKHFSLSIKDLKNTATEIKHRFESFQNGLLPIQSVLQSPQELYILAVEKFISTYPGNSGVDIEIGSDLIMGSGMGSSAATLASIYHALHKHFGQPFSTEDIYRLTLDTERFQHGRPSGIDPYISTYGGFIRFENQTPVRLNLNIPDFNLIHTGFPSSTTGECVMAVQKFADRKLWQSFSDTTRLFERALINQDRQDLIKAVQRNHRLLDHIGVVPAKPREFIKEIERMGGGAKISGAGCINGPHAGLIIAFLDKNPQELCTAYGYQLINIAGDDHGVRIA